jgi:hypothetical protein
MERLAGGFSSRQEVAFTTHPADELNS